MSKFPDLLIVVEIHDYWTLQNNADCSETRYIGDGGTTVHSSDDATKFGTPADACDAIGSHELFGQSFYYRPTFCARKDPDTGQLREDDIEKLQQWNATWSARVWDDTRKIWVSQEQATS